MSQTRPSRQARALASLALAVLLVLPACARRPIPSPEPTAGRHIPLPADDAVPAAVPAAKPLAQVPDQAADPAAAPEAPAAPLSDGSGAEGSDKAATQAYFVQIGSFGTEKNAEGAMQWLKEHGYEQTRMVRLEQDSAVFLRVQAGPYPGVGPAQAALVKLKAAWPQAFILGD